MPETQEAPTLCERLADVVARIQQRMHREPYGSQLDAILELLEELEAEVKGK